MPGLSIIGTGRYLPGRPYTNHDLARVMDTNDDWIRQRTGIKQRHFCPVGLGAADLALPACQQALEAARLAPGDIDYILFNTMTPDNLFPGPGALLGARLGCVGVPALDLRTQCAAMIFALQVAESLLTAGSARRILIVGAEAHAPVMPFDWDVLEGRREGKPSDAAWALATEHRGWAVIFGDGAGALVVERAERPEAGIIAVDLHSDGRYAHELCIPAGFKRPDAPIASENFFEAARIHMNGRDVFKHAVTKLPRSVIDVCEKARVRVSDVDWFVAHQANQRINESVCERLGVPAEKMPGNIDRYGNTSAATIPILLDEMQRDGRLKPGQLVCFLALGAGFHWGSALVRW